MSGDIKTEHLFFFGKTVLKVEFGHVRKDRLIFRRGLFVAEETEDRDLAFHRLLLRGRKSVEIRLGRADHLRSRDAEFIHRGRKDQALDHLLIDLEVLASSEEITEGGELTVDLTIDNELSDGAFTDVLNGRQTDTDLLVTLGRELHKTLIDRRRQDLDAHLLTDGRVPGGRGLISEEAVEHRGHKLRRIVVFEVSGIVTDHGISGSVGLIERISRELRYVVKDLSRDRLGYAVGDRTGNFPALFVFSAVDKCLAVFFHEGGLLLRHGAADVVGLAHREAREISNDLHDLFLIDHTSVGHVQDRLEERMIVLNGRRIVTGRHIFRDLVHRARTVKRDARDNVLKRGRFQVDHKRCHARTFKLEHTLGVAAADHLKDRRFIHRDTVEVDLDALVLQDHLRGIAHDRQRAKAEEVKLQKSDLFGIGFGKLNDDRLVVFRKRRDLGKRLSGDNDACRVR